MRKESDQELLVGELHSLQDFFAYNTFVRKEYLSFLSKLAESTLEKDRGASYPSLLDIFSHVLDVYKCWIRAYETNKLASAGRTSMRQERNCLNFSDSH